MVDRVQVAHLILPGSQATWFFEVDDVRFRVVVTVDEPAAVAKEGAR